MYNVLTPRRLSQLRTAFAAKLSPVITVMLWYSPTEKQVCQSMQHRIMGELSIHINRKAFPAVFIQDREHPGVPSHPSSGHAENHSSIHDSYTQDEVEYKIRR